MRAAIVRRDKGAFGDRSPLVDNDLWPLVQATAAATVASVRVVRHSLVWPGQVAPVVRENEDAGHLDLLGGSCLLLARTSLGTGEEDRRLLAPSVGAFSTTLADLARQPGDRAIRQQAVDRSLEVLRGMRSAGHEPDADLTTALTAARIAVSDLMLFVGVDPDEARAATRDEARSRQDLEVRVQAPERRPPFRRVRRWLRRWSRRRWR